MIRDASTPGIPDTTIQRWINILLAIDRKLVQNAISDAAGQGVNPQKIADSQAALAKGDADVSSGD